MPLPLFLALRVLSVCFGEDLTSPAELRLPQERGPNPTCARPIGSGSSAGGTLWREGCHGPTGHGGRENRREAAESDSAPGGQGGGVEERGLWLRARPAWLGQLWPRPSAEQG